MGLLDDMVRDRRRFLIAVALIFILAAALRFYQIQWSFSNNGIDEGVMTERAFMVGQGYKLYSALPCDQPPLAFYMGAALGGAVLPLREMVAAMSLVAIGAAMLVSWKTGSSKAVLVTGLLLSVDFVFLRESRLFSLDALAACFVAFSIPAFMHYVKRGTRTALAFAGLFSGLATASKLLGALALIGMLLYMALEWRRERSSTRRLACDVVTAVAAAAAPLVIFMAYLGPGEVLRGMVTEQGQRGFDAYLKLSIIAYFGLNIAYLLPLVRARALWSASKEARFLMCVVVAMLAFMVLQPLVFLHHMTVMSPPLAILTGLVVSDVFAANKRESMNMDTQSLVKKRRSMSRLILAALVASVVVSAGLTGYGLLTQKEPVQIAYADWLSNATTPDEFVVSGDPIICAYAHRMMPPDLVNVAYRQHDDLTLGRVISSIEEYNVSVVIVCYRLSDINGLTDYLTGAGFVKVPSPVDRGAGGSLDLFENGIGPVVVFIRPG
jgi:4-amino-4-deoxy-L-arabinose transferase-like glycosyltransferase